MSEFSDIEVDDDFGGNCDFNINELSGIEGKIML